LRIGLVIVTYNAAPYIARCLSAVAAQSRVPDRVILFDNASSDATVTIGREAASSLGLAIEIEASGTNIGFAAANNRCVERLTDCDLVVTLNPDAFPERDWMATLVDAARRHPEAASLASRLVTAEDASRLDGIGDVFHVSGLAWRRGHRQRVQDVDDAEREQPIFSACAAAALYRRADWMAAGGFDERFFCYAEDVDLGFRLQLADRPCWYVPSAVVSHVGSAASNLRSGFAVYHGHRNLEWAYLKNMPTGLLVRYMPLHLFASLSAIVWFTVRGAGGSILRAKWDALRGVRETLRQRQRVQASRRVSSAALRQRLDRSPLWRRFRHRAGYA
jgi:GT2 family glycosyltransferase